MKLKQRGPQFEAELERLRYLVGMVERLREGPLVRQHWAYGPEELKWDVFCNARLDLEDRDVEHLARLSELDIELVVGTDHREGGRLAHEYRRFWTVLHNGSQLDILMEPRETRDDIRRRVRQTPTPLAVTVSLPRYDWLEVVWVLKGFLDIPEVVKVLDAIRDRLDQDLRAQRPPEVVR